ILISRLIRIQRAAMSFSVESRACSTIPDWNAFDHLFELKAGLTETLIHTIKIPSRTTGFRVIAIMV
ncbi:MAG: hypothetical protein WBM85_12295, partial [Eudoraea sp.]